jgi:hypothetical protein
MPGTKRPQTGEQEVKTIPQAFPIPSGCEPIEPNKAQSSLIELKNAVAVFPGHRVQSAAVPIGLRSKRQQIDANVNGLEI